MCGSSLQVRKEADFGSKANVDQCTKSVALVFLQAAV